MMFWHYGFNAAEWLGLPQSGQWKWKYTTGDAMSSDNTFFGYIEPLTWRKCTDVLPADGATVLAKHKDGHVYSCVYSGPAGVYSYSGKYKDMVFRFAEFSCGPEEIAYWTPMPKGPSP
jgi:hypothetical protein